MIKPHRANIYPDEIVHPTCEKCGAPMWLARVDHVALDANSYTFECQACGNSVSDWEKSERDSLTSFGM